MDCIYCGKNTKVTNSRSRGAYETWRRRACKGCKALVTSIEQVRLDDSLKVAKRNSKIEPFVRDKLFLSIYRSVDHLDKPVFVSTHLTNNVLRHILKLKPLNPVVSSANIADITAKVLKNYNAAASVRYLSFQTQLSKPIDVRRSLK
jgi:transcriptional regulator NrdR family protein